jgi:hypothetical protein
VIVVAITVAYSTLAIAGVAFFRRGRWKEQWVYKAMCEDE